jgi:hypothetical protein
MRSPEVEGGGAEHIAAAHSPLEAVIEDCDGIVAARRAQTGSIDFDLEDSNGGQAPIPEPGVEPMAHTLLAFVLLASAPADEVLDGTKIVSRPTAAGGHALWHFRRAAALAGPDEQQRKMFAGVSAMAHSLAAQIELATGDDRLWGSCDAEDEVGRATAQLKEQLKADKAFEAAISDGRITFRTIDASVHAFGMNVIGSLLGGVPAHESWNVEKLDADVDRFEEALRRSVD